jgi:hypothetical protein
MNYTDQLSPYLAGSQPPELMRQLALIDPRQVMPLQSTPTQQQVQQAPLPSGITFADMQPAIDDRRPGIQGPGTGENHHRPIVWHPDADWSNPMGGSLANLDAQLNAANNARAHQNNAFARAMGINDIGRLTPQSFGTTDDGNVFFNYGR